MYLHRNELCNSQHIGRGPKYICNTSLSKTNQLPLLLALHFVFFLITNILLSKYQVFLPFYQNSLVFTIKNKVIVAQFPLLIKNIPVIFKSLTSSFNIRYGGLCNQLIIWKWTHQVVRANIWSISLQITEHKNNLCVHSNIFSSKHKWICSK